MSKCITVKDYLDTLREIAQGVEIDQLGDPETRVNVWDITDGEVNQMLETFKAPKSVSAQSKRLRKKLKQDLGKIGNHIKKKLKQWLIE